MVTALLVETAPPLSVARAVSVWLPAETFRHVKEKGALVSWPSTVVPSRNSTLVTVPSASLAVAWIVMVGFQVKIPPSTGYVMLTLGGVLDGGGGGGGGGGGELFTVMPDARLVVAPPKSSVARAVSE